MRSVSNGSSVIVGDVSTVEHESRLHAALAMEYASYFRSHRWPRKIPVVVRYSRPRQEIPLITFLFAAPDSVSVRPPLSIT